MRLRANITEEEITCKCGCGLNKISSAILDVVQEAREHFNKPVVIHSACRCNEHNKAVGGKEHSLHKLDQVSNVCRAIDFHVKDISIDELHTYLIEKYPNSLGIGKYKTFCHVDDRMERAFRWDYG